MVTFMEKSSLEARNGHSFRDETLQSHFSKDAFPHHQLSGHQIHYFLTEPHFLANKYNVYSARTIIDNFIKREGNEPMG